MLFLSLTLSTLISMAPTPSPHSFATGHYQNLFHEIGKSDREIDDKIGMAWRQLFYGDDRTQRIYYPAGPDMAYIKDVGNNDVRSEGMSYGMMIAVQLGHKAEFDRLWRWAKAYMWHPSGIWKGTFSWQCDESGKRRSEMPAPDGEEYFATALYFAAGRWGSDHAVLNYRHEADAMLHAALHKEQENGGVVGGAHNLFDMKEKQVVFVPYGDAAGFTDPSYHLPAFYELWSRWAREDRSFWLSAVAASRRLLHAAVNPQTGLAPDYASFAGTPKRAPWDPNSKADTFQSDAFRVAQNIAVDYEWFGADPWEAEQSELLLKFLAGQKPNYVSSYTVDGKPFVNYRSTGLVAMNAVAALAAGPKLARSFIEDLWTAPIPTGQWRYYDGMLYMLGLLHASGHFKIWTPR